MPRLSDGPISLLEALGTGPGFEAALITTFSGYLPFVEEVVLRRLRASGCNYVVLLMDGTQLSLEFADPRHRPSSAGRRYGLLPIAGDGIFHPKVALLVGPKTARVVIGSHNLTMAGFIRNREVTNVINVDGPKDRSGSAAVVEVLEFCKAWATTLPAGLKRAVDDFDVFCRPYLGPSPESSAVEVVGSRPTGLSLWQRVRRKLPDRATRVAILGPFFDSGLSFVRRVAEDLQPEEIVIGIEPKTACFPGNTTKLPREARVVDSHDLNPGHKGRGYLHAKAVLIESKSERVLITGSANPTAAAWLASAGPRNAEIVVVRRLTASDTQDLSLGGLWKGQAVAPGILAGLRARTARSEFAAGLLKPLVGICDGETIRIPGPFRHVAKVVIRDAHRAELPSTVQKKAAELIVTLPERIDQASSIEAVLDGALRHGFIHHVDLLRETAVSSAQGRVRDALGGLSGNASELAELLRLVDKLIFESPSAESGIARKGKTNRRDAETGSDETTVTLVGTLREATGKVERHLSTGDLGLLLDYLMRELWQSLSHEPSPGTRPETELIETDDEELVRQLPADEKIAAAWHRKSRTLLRRLQRRIEEGHDPIRIVNETAAVLGVLERLRRVEDQDRWHALRVEFVDREAAEDFVFEAAPRLFGLRTGLIDAAAKTAGALFAEQKFLIERAAWIAWLTGVGPADLHIYEDPDEDPDESDSAVQVAERLARACLIGARMAGADRARIIELLEASPIAGVDPRVWLDSLVRLGEAYLHPSTVLVLKRPPQSGDLVVTQGGTGPYLVRSVRGNKIDLIDFTRQNETATFLANMVRVLDSGVEPKLRAVG